MNDDSDEHEINYSGYAAKGEAASMPKGKGKGKGAAKEEASSADTSKEVARTKGKG